MSILVHKREKGIEMYEGKHCLVGEESLHYFEPQLSFSYEGFLIVFPRKSIISCNRIIQTDDESVKVIVTVDNVLSRPEDLRWNFYVFVVEKKLDIADYKEGDELQIVGWRIKI